MSFIHPTNPPIYKNNSDPTLASASEDLLSLERIIQNAASELLTSPTRSPVKAVMDMLADNSPDNILNRQG